MKTKYLVVSVVIHVLVLLAVVGLAHAGWF